MLRVVESGSEEKAEALPSILDELAREGTVWGGHTIRAASATRTAKPILALARATPQGRQAMQCQQTNCEGTAKKHGRDRYGSQRWKCRECGKTWSEPREKLLGDMRISEDKALMALHLLCEGSSIPSVSRVTGLHKNSIMKLLVQVGQQCETYLAENVRDVPVQDVQCDELWAYVAMKQKTKNQKSLDDPEVGDAWTFLGIDRDSKLVLCWRLGQRTHQHTDAFIEKLDRAISGHFQLTTDGMQSYPDSVGYHLGSRTDFAQLIKEYGSDSAEDQRRYSPAR